MTLLYNNSFGWALRAVPTSLNPDYSLFFFVACKSLKVDLEKGPSWPLGANLEVHKPNLTSTLKSTYSFQVK